MAILSVLVVCIIIIHEPRETVELIQRFSVVIQPRDAMLSAVYATAILSVRPSVCLYKNG